MEIKNEFINNSIQFDGFTIGKIVKEGNPSIDAHLNLEIKSDIDVDGEDVKVLLEMDVTEANTEFRFIIAMCGRFTVSAVSIEELKPNLLAIMFPYVRSSATFITSLDDQPPLILPPINFIEYAQSNMK